MGLQEKGSKKGWCKLGEGDQAMLMQVDIQSMVQN